MLRSLCRILLLLVIVLLLAISSSQLAELHQRFLIARTSDAVVMVTKSPKRRYGGSGFQIALAGKKYIVTNGHVCDSIKNQGAVISQGIKTWKRRIIGQSMETDLCFVEGIEELPSLTLGTDRGRFERILVVGHPFLQPATPQVGRILAEKIIKIRTHKEERECRGPNYKWEEVFSYFGSYDVCTRSIRSIMTTSPVFPGSSGSPVVNFWGQVVGVIFAGDFSGRTSYYVPVSDLEDFLDTVAKTVP